MKNKSYSKAVPKILETNERVRIGKQIETVLKDFLGKTRELDLLDVGCSSGVISNHLSKSFRSVVAIDVDIDALKLAKETFRGKNINFYNMDASKTTFPKNKFDVVVANQVYEFVKNDKKFMNEVWRVLKPGGICFFGGRNKFAVIEAQYGIPFLSWINKKNADKIVRFFGLGEEFVGKYRSYGQLKELVKTFVIHDYTAKILANPSKYGFRNLSKYKYLLRLFPVNLIYPFIPNYIWILEKR